MVFLEITLQTNFFFSSHVLEMYFYKSVQFNFAKNKTKQSWDLNEMTHPRLIVLNKDQLISVIYQKFNDH